MKKIILFVIFFDIFLFGGLFYYFDHWKKSPFIGIGASPVSEFEVVEGSSLQGLAETLESKGFISNSLLFKVLVKFDKETNKLAPGLYQFDSPTNPQKILEKLKSGKTWVVKVTFAEGLNMYQVADKIVENFPTISVVPLKELMLRPSDKLKKMLPFPAKTLEGFLFPSTYDFSPRSTAESVLTKMISTFVVKAWPLLQGIKAKNGLSPTEILTLASLVEKESGKSVERPMIAGVFYNRLEKKMRLQTDPSVIYGIWSRYDGNLRKQDLLTPGPYNSYTNFGLPPGPIANPGLESIKAALEPQKTRFFFFVGKGDGSHIFSESLESHSKAVKQFQVDPYLKSLGSKKSGPVLKK